MSTQTFSAVWYLPEENKWRDMNLLAFRDAGTLTVGEDSLEFRGKKTNVRITNVQRISYGKQGRDFVNNWVKIEYDNDKTAFFADGSSLGWGGFLGGTKKILNAVQQVATTPAAPISPAESFVVATTPAAPISPAKSFPARVVGVLISPRETFADIARQPHFIWVLLAAVIVPVILTTTMIARIGAEQIVRLSFAQSPAVRNMSAEQMQQAVEYTVKMFSMTTLYSLILGVVISTIFPLVLAGIGFAILNVIFGAHLDYRSNIPAVAVTCYAYVPIIVGALTGLLMIFAADPTRFNPHNFTPTNVGFFLNPRETSMPFLALATSIDLFSFWYLALLGIGFSAVTGRRVKAGPIFLSFLGLWIIWTLGKMGIAMLA